MKYHFFKWYSRIADILKMLRLVFGSKSFIIAYNAKVCMDICQAQDVLFIGVKTLEYGKNEQNGTKLPDILINPYRYPTETKKEYMARVMAGMLR